MEMPDVEYKTKKSQSITLNTGSAAEANLATLKDVPITVTASKSIEIGLTAESSTVSMELTASAGSIEGEPYEGPYAVTPSKRTQILQTKNLVATANITVEPIPDNYGLITWDGSILTVS